ncbi:MAG: 3',5'-cyclic-AMP phosphodiesterase [Woeseia sp.]
MSADPIRVLHVTDPHLFADSESSLRGTVTHSSLSDVLAHIHDSGWNADLVAMTGDLIQDGSHEAYDRFCKLMRPLGLPVYCVPGNHDVRSIMKDALAGPEFHYCESCMIANWQIAGIDSCISGDAGGRIEAHEMERLESLLDDTTADHVLICLHHPPLPVGSKWLDQVGLSNGEEFLRLIARTGKVRAAIFGHVHQNFEALRDSISIIGTPSTCRQFKPGSEDFALDDNPPAYRRISLQPDGGLDTQLIWLTD